MKRNSLIIFVNALLLLFFLGGCSEQSELNRQISEDLENKEFYSRVEEAKALALPISELNSIPPSVKRERAAAITLADFVTLQGTSYFLNISKEDAKKIGIEYDLYDKVKKSLALSNDAIKKAIKKGEKLQLPDIKKEAEKYKRKSAQSFLEAVKGVGGIHPSYRPDYGRQTGSIRTDGSVGVSDSFTPNPYKYKIQYFCTTSAALVVIYHCGVMDFGGARYKNTVGCLFYCSRIELPLKAAGGGTRAIIGFSSSDPYGSYCNWRAI